MTRVKVCGITSFEDAELAVELGAWALGFILWPGSKRAVELPVAAGIGRALRRRTQLVGVFVDAPLDEIALASDAIGLTHVQLHGGEGPAFCTAVAQRTGARVIKAVRIASGADVQALEPFRTDLHLLDGAGGQPWDWNLIRRRRSKVPVMLAGGLTPENVAEGIAAVSPFAVDTASGTEASPGVKDPEKLRAFFRAVDSDRSAAGPASPVPGGPPASDGGPPASDGGPPASDGGPPASDGGPPASDGGPPASDDPAPAPPAATTEVPA